LERPAQDAFNPNSEVDSTEANEAVTECSLSEGKLLDLAARRGNPSPFVSFVASCEFGIGFRVQRTVGSHEFILGHAITRRKLLCPDAGHFHPTARRALQEESRSLPRGAAWDFYYETKGVPVGAAWRPDGRKNGADVLLIRNQSRTANKLADDSDSGKL
jgi:L-rhamnose isomerase